MLIGKSSVSSYRDYLGCVNLGIGALGKMRTPILEFIGIPLGVASEILQESLMERIVTVQFWQVQKATSAFLLAWVE